MRAHRIVLTLAWIVAMAVQGLASPAWMTDADLRATFAGRDISGEYENGDTFEETYAADGAVRYSDARRASSGKWSVGAGTFCTIYDDDPAGGCYRVRKASENCFEFHFVARTEDQASKAPGKPAWTARGWIANQPKTCVDGESV